MAPAAMLISLGLFCEPCVSLSEPCSVLSWGDPDLAGVSSVPPGALLAFAMALFVPGLPGDSAGPWAQCHTRRFDMALIKLGTSRSGMSLRLKS